ncbi:ParA family protein [Paraburkholderia sediminicola]|uniref:ParA family protein n=1 Tax=Paraburkholderia sediminicola TaxID=458836 RepID=UPI0038BD6A0D
MKTLLIATEQGGSGKTAMLCQFAHYLHRVQRLRVLVIDAAEPPCSTASLVRACRAVVLRGEKSIRQSERGNVAAPGLWVLPTGTVPSLTLGPGDDGARYYANVRHLLFVVAPLADVCLIDSPPLPDLRALCIESTVDAMLSPIRLNRESLDSVADLINGPHGVRQIRATLNPTLQFVGLLPNMVEATSLGRENARAVETQFGRWLIADPGIPGGYLHIPRFVAVQRAQAEGVPVGEVVGREPTARRAWQTMLACFDALTGYLRLDEVAYDVEA